MSLHKPRFFHERLDTYLGMRFKGFSVQLLPTDEQGTVDVRVTFCSPKDQWNYKAARAACLKAPVRRIKVTELPKFVTILAEKCWDVTPTDAQLKEKEYGNQYAWLLKYFL